MHAACDEPDARVEVRIELKASDRMRLRIMSAAKGLTRSQFVAELIDRADRDHFSGQAAILVSAPTPTSSDD